MGRSIVPVNIRPHLIPFLYQEFEGIEAHYIRTKVKAAKISTRSTLGKIIRLMIEKADKPEKIDNFNVFLNVSDVEKSKFFGSVFKAQSGKHTFLRLPDPGVKLLNDYLEDNFRLSFVAFVCGYTAEPQQQHFFKQTRSIQDAIEAFMDTYNLRELGFSKMTLQKYYERETKSDATLRRMQKAVSNRSLNYA